MIDPKEDPKRWEQGYQFIATEVAKRDAEIARLNGHLDMLRELLEKNSVDKKNGNG